MMICNRDYRLSSLNGYVVNFKANEPAQVPPHVYAEAVGIGAVPMEEPELDAPRERSGYEVDESVHEAAAMEAEAQKDAVQRVIVTLFEKNDTSLFRADGYPKVVSVLDALPGTVPKPTAMEIQAIFDEMRYDVKYADLMGS